MYSVWGLISALSVTEDVCYWLSLLLVLLTLLLALSLLFSS